MQSYNDAMAAAAAEAQSEEDYVQYQMLLHKAQTASFESIRTMAQEIETQRDQLLADAEDAHLSERFRLEYRWNQAIADRTLVNGQVATAAMRDEALAAADAAYQQKVTQQNAYYDDLLLKMWESTMQQSELADAYATLGSYADRYLAGEITAETASDIIGDLYGKSKYAGDNVAAWNNPVRQQLGEYVARMVSSLGGYEGIQDKMDYYMSMGDTASAQSLARLLTMEGLATDFAWMNVVSDAPFGWMNGEVVGMEGMRNSSYSTGLDYANFKDQVGSFIADYNVDIARKTVEAFSGKKNDLGAYFEAIGRGIKYEDGSEFAFQPLNGYYVDELEHIMDGLRSVYDFEKVLADESTVFAESGSAYRDYIAAYSLLYGNASQHANDYLIQAQVEPVVPEGAIQEAAGDATIPAEVVPEASDETGAVAIPAEVTGQTEAAANALADAQGVMDAGLTADAAVTGLYASAVSERTNAQAYLSANPGTWKVRTVRTGSLPTASLFAEGGRATEPSIFGEAGPEWAIPEEHTDRVASLFNAARQAAGFTWPELIERNGGLNAGGTTPTQIVYAPTIVANDASGVEQKLIEDKERLNQWWEEKKMRDDVEVFS